MIKNILKIWVIVSFVLAPILGKLASLEDDDELSPASSTD